MGIIGENEVAIKAKNVVAVVTIIALEARLYAKDIRSIKSSGFETK